MTPNNFQIANQHFRITLNFQVSTPLKGVLTGYRHLKEAGVDSTY